MNEVTVSVICLTYNHEAYLRRTLEGFVMQKADFLWEAIVHEDASTDGTAAILHEFADNYPELIRPVFQTENQYSKPDTPIVKTFVEPLLRGRYVALCDGDDPFTDPLKLKKQVEYMDAHPECSICVHRAVNRTEGPEGKDTLYPAEEADCDFSAEDMIRFGAGKFATNSFLIRREVYCGMPDVFRMPGVGDYNTLMYAAICGKVHYMADVMSVHYDGAAGSWTERIWNDLPKRIAHENDMISFLSEIDAYYEGRYHEAFEDAVSVRKERVMELVYHRLMSEGRTDEAKRGEYKAFYEAEQKAKRREKLRSALPGLVNLKRRLMGQERYEEKKP